MPSSIYISVLNRLMSYLDRGKAEDVLKRYLSSDNVSPDTFNAQDLQRLMPKIVGAAGLYIADKGKREDMANALRALV